MDKPTTPAPLDPVSTVPTTSQPPVPPTAPGRRVFSAEKPNELPFTRSGSLPGNSTIFKAHDALSRMANAEEQKANTSQLGFRRFSDARLGNIGRHPALERSRVNTGPDALGLNASRRLTEEANLRSRFADGGRRSIMDLQKSMVDPVFRKITNAPILSQMQIQNFKHTKTEPLFPEAMIYKVKKVSMKRKLDPEIGKIRLRIDKFGNQELNKFPKWTGLAPRDRPYLDDPNSVSSKRTFSKKNPNDDQSSLASKSNKQDKPLPSPVNLGVSTREALKVPEARPSLELSHPTSQKPQDEMSTLRLRLANETAEQDLSSRRFLGLKPVPVIQVKPKIALPRHSANDRRTNFSQERPVHKRVSDMSVGREETIEVKKPQRNSSVEDKLLGLRAKLIRRDPLISNSRKPIGDRKRNSLVNEGDEPNRADPLAYGQKYGGNMKVDKSSIIIDDEFGTPEISDLQDSKMNRPGPVSQLQSDGKAVDLGTVGLQAPPAEPTKQPVSGSDGHAAPSPTGQLSAKPFDDEPQSAPAILSSSEGSSESDLKEEEKDIVPKIDFLKQLKDEQGKDLNTIHETDEENKSYSSRFPTELHFGTKVGQTKRITGDVTPQHNSNSKNSSNPSQGRLSEPDNSFSGIEGTSRPAIQSLKGLADEDKSPANRRKTLNPAQVRERPASPPRRSEPSPDTKGVISMRKPKDKGAPNAEVIAESEHSVGDQSYFDLTKEQSKAGPKATSPSNSKAPREGDPAPKLAEPLPEGQVTDDLSASLPLKDSGLEDYLDNIHKPEDGPEPEISSIPQHDKHPVNQSAEISWNFSKESKHEPEEPKQKTSIEPDTAPRNFTFGMPALNTHPIDQSETFVEPEPQPEPERDADASQRLSKLLVSAAENLLSPSKPDDPQNKSTFVLDPENNKQVVDKRAKVSVNGIEAVEYEAMDFASETVREIRHPSPQEPALSISITLDSEHIRSPINHLSIEPSSVQVTELAEELEFNKNKVPPIEPSLANFSSFPEEIIRPVGRATALEPETFQTITTLPGPLQQTLKSAFIEPVEASFSIFPDEPIRPIIKPLGLLPQSFAVISKDAENTRRIIQTPPIEPLTLSFSHRKPEPVRKAIKARAVAPKTRVIFDLPIQDLQVSPPAPTGQIRETKNDAASQPNPLRSPQKPTPAKRVLGTRFGDNATPQVIRHPGDDEEGSPKSSKASVRSQVSLRDSAKENNEETGRPTPTRQRGERTRIDLPDPNPAPADAYQQQASERTPNRRSRPNRSRATQPRSKGVAQDLANFAAKFETHSVRSISEGSVAYLTVESTPEPTEVASAKHIEDYVAALTSKDKVKHAKHVGAICCIFFFLSSVLWIVLLKILNDKNGFLSSIILHPPTLDAYHDVYTQFFMNYDNNHDLYTQSRKALGEQNFKDYHAQSKSLASVSALKTDNSVSMLTIKAELAHLVNRVPSRNQVQSQTIDHGLEHARRLDKTSIDDMYRPRKRVSPELDKITERLKKIRMHLSQFTMNRDITREYFIEVQRSVDAMYRRSFQLIDDYGRFYVMTSRIWATTENIYQTFKSRAEEVTEEMKTPHFTLLSEKHKGIKLLSLHYKTWAKVTVFPPYRLATERRSHLMCSIKAEVLDPEMQLLGREFDFFLSLNGRFDSARRPFQNKITSAKTSILIPQILELPPGNNQVELVAQLPTGDITFTKMYVNCVHLLDFKKIPEFPKLNVAS